jgi:hypothetical protein
MENKGIDSNGGKWTPDWKEFAGGGVPNDVAKQMGTLYPII